MKEVKKMNKSHYMMAVSVGMVLFSAHAGGGFATGNQANTFFVSLGWPGILSAFLAMLILTRTMKEAMVMYNTRKLNSYKELFETLYAPFDKLAILFDVFFYIMVIMAIAATISGAASALQEYFPLYYPLYVGIVGMIVLLLTIFGAEPVRRVSTVLGIIILISAISIYMIGIIKAPNIGDIFSMAAMEEGVSTIPKALINSLVYAGFQCVTLPTMIVCGKILQNRKDIGRSMNFSFVINTAALILSVIMLMSWQGFYTSIDNGTTLPTLFVTEKIGWNILYIAYGLSLVLCLLSTGVTTTFGFVSRFENMKALSFIDHLILRRAIVAIFIISLSMGISMVGLTNIIKYGYGYCGYLAIFVIIIPMLTVGVYKNRTYGRQHLELVQENV
ncbi:MAG: hypothetical protein Q4P25_05140 [Tissierellia bacterium]|nr:hypothetical protein [Tissierellia bacterium]